MGVFIEEWSRGTARDPLQHFRKRAPRECTVCGFKGYFISAGPRQEARCPSCSSKERDRILALYMRNNNLSAEGKRILHFSPERPFWRQWKNYPDYVSGDIKLNKVANTIVDITKLQFADNSFDWIICNHVLEHVDEDRKGMEECFRVLKHGGIGFFSVPLDGELPETFEPPADMPIEEIQRICGRTHVRLYGLDFGDKLAAVGFDVERAPFSEQDKERFRLSAGHADIIFVARKRAVS